MLLVYDKNSPEKVLPLSNSLPLVIIVPCYNEESRLPIPAFQNYFRANPHQRFLFVNDGSRDQTSRVLAQLAASFPQQAFVLDNAHNQGKANAVRDGLLHAIDTMSPAFIGYWDADLATPLDCITPMALLLEQDPKLWMVLGSRVRLLGRRIVRKPARHYLGRIFATVASLVLQLPVYDTQCGAKLFRVSPRTRLLFAERFASKWVFDVEILARFLTLPPGPDKAPPEDAIYEFSLPRWEDVDGSKVRPKDFITAFLDIAGIWKRYFLSPR